MKLRNPQVIKLAAFVASLVIRVWMSTIRYRIVSLDAVEHPADYRRNRFLYSIWHESILFLTGLRTRIHILISQHADGEFIARVCGHLGGDVVRGSTTRGGTKAVLDMLKFSGETHLLVTPDGPRGPRRKLQRGVIYLASKSGMPIVPCGIAWGKCWRANSWDRFAVPYPFSVAYGVAGEAISVPPNLSRQQQEEYRQLVEQRMRETNAVAERWASGGILPRRQAIRFESPKRRSA